MKKLAALATIATYLSTTASHVLAQAPGAPTRSDTITILAPSKGYDDLGKFITAAINLVFVVAVIAVLIMLVWGAIQWIFSGGEKDAVASARNRIVHALVGLAVLAVAFAIAAVFGKFVGIDLLGTLIIPNPTNPNALPNLVPR